MNHDAKIIKETLTHRRTEPLKTLDFPNKC
jgi:hypothetical protein